MKRIAILLAIALESFAAVALAQDSPEQTFYFDCDTAEGIYSEWSLDVIKPNVTLSGTLELRRTRRHPQWVPTASFFVTALDKSFSAALRVEWSHPKPTGGNVLMVNVPARGQPELIGRNISPKSPVPFSITFSDEGRVELQIANIMRTVQVPSGRPVRTGLGCSTAQVVFSSIKVQ